MEDVQFLRSWITLSLYNIIAGRVFSILILLIHIYEKIFMRFVVIEYFAEARVIYKRYQGILHRTRAASLLLFFTTHYTERCRNAKQCSPFRAGQIDRLKWPMDRLKDSDSGFNPEIRSDCDSFSASSNKGKKTRWNWSLARILIARATRGVRKGFALNAKWFLIFPSDMWTYKGVHSYPDCVLDVHA